MTLDHETRMLLKRAVSDLTRVRLSGECVNCGAALTGTQKRFCSGTCGKRHWRTSTEKGRDWSRRNNAKRTVRRQRYVEQLSGQTFDRPARAHLESGSLAGQKGLL